MRQDKQRITHAAGTGARPLHRSETCATINRLGTCATTIGLLTGAALLSLLCGCPPQGEGTGPSIFGGPPVRPPADRREALLRVNENLAQINQPLQYKALVSFSFTDENGKAHRFIGHEAALSFLPPQDLCFEVRSLAGVVAQFGSNADRYWVWVEPELNKLWWGEWKNTRDDAVRRLPIPPNELLDALMLRPLPEGLQGGLLPLLRVQDADFRLLFVRLGPDRQPSGWREIRLDPRPPYQPTEIVDRQPDGGIVMRAQLSSYERVGGSGPFTARKYVVEWPVNHAEMRLDINRASFRPDLPADVFEFPAGWKGAQERIDEPQPAA